MKKYLFCALALLVALTVGCGRRNTAQTAAPQQAVQGNGNNAHSHEGCGHDYSADARDSRDGHDHSGHSHEAETAHDHSHENGESCSGDHSHEGHNHDAHAEHSHAGGESCGHDHSHDGHAEHPGSAHEKHDHSADEVHAGHDHSGHSHDAHTGHDHGDGEMSADEIVFPAEQAARTDFKVERPALGKFHEVIKCGGEVTAAQGSVSVVAAPISGVVTMVDGRIMASTPVAKGQKLFYISSGSLASGDAALKARIAFEQAKAEFERAERLYRDKIISQSDYLAAQAAYLTAQSEYEPVRNMNRDGSVTITARAAGYLSQVSVSAGDYVEMGQPLATVARSGRMQLKAMVSQRYFDRLGGIADANFRMPSSDKYYNVKSMNGSLYAAGRIVSQGSALIPVVFEFDGGGNVPDGAYVEVSLLGRTRDKVMTLPLTAVTEQQGLYYVYVQLDAEHYSRREVALGADDGVRVEILSGICGHDRVVTRGAVNVKMAAASGAIPHGHTH